MFDIGAAELLVIVVVAVLVIGPKDMPLALRTVGRWMGKVRRVSNHFRTGIDAMIREAEMEDMERKWQERNKAIMDASSSADPPFEGGAHTPQMEPLDKSGHRSASAQNDMARDEPDNTAVAAKGGASEGKGEKDLPGPDASTALSEDKNR